MVSLSVAGSWLQGGSHPAGAVPIRILRSGPLPILQRRGLGGKSQTHPLTRGEPL